MTYLGQSALSWNLISKTIFLLQNISPWNKLVSRLHWFRFREFLINYKRHYIKLIPVKLREVSSYFFIYTWLFQGADCTAKHDQNKKLFWCYSRFWEFFRLQWLIWKFLTKYKTKVTWFFTSFEIAWFNKLCYMLFIGGDNSPVISHN